MSKIYTPYKSKRLQRIYEKEYDTYATSWPVKSECLSIKTTYGTSYVRISGKENGKTIVLLPGAASSSLWWSNMVEDLITIGYKVVAIDHINQFGRSCYSTKISTTSILVDWLEQTLVQLDITNTIELMGLSFGGWLCGQYALSYFSKIHRITLLAPFGTIYWPKFGVWPQLLLCAIPSRCIRNQFSYWCLNNAYHRNDEARVMVERWAKEFNLGFKCMRMTITKMNKITIEQLRTIQSKTTIVLGMLDRLIHSRKILDTMQLNGYQGTVEVLNNAGHDVTFTHNKLIIDLLKQ